MHRRPLQQQQQQPQQCLRSTLSLPGLGLDPTMALLPLTADSTVRGVPQVSIFIFLYFASPLPLHALYLVNPRKASLLCLAAHETIIECVGNPPRPGATIPPRHALCIGNMLSCYIMSPYFRSQFLSAFHPQLDWTRLTRSFLFYRYRTCALQILPPGRVPGWIRMSLQSRHRSSSRECLQVLRKGMYHNLCLDYIRVHVKAAPRVPSSLAPSHSSDPTTPGSETLPCYRAQQLDRHTDRDRC